MKDKQKEFSDINLKMNQVNLPRGAGPIQFNSNFGNTAALMLTVASPIATPTEVALRAIPIRKAIEETRSHLAKNAPQPRVSVIYAFPLTVAAGPVRTNFEMIANIAERNGTLRDLHFFDGPGYVGLDASTSFDDETIRQRGDSSSGTICRPRNSIPTRGSRPSFAIPLIPKPSWPKVAGAKYSYRQLDNYTDLIQRTLQGVPETSTVSRSGVLPEQIYLDYSQQRLAQYGYDPSKLKDILNAQNITLPAGSLEVGPQDLVINPSGLFTDAPADRQRHHRRLVLEQSGLPARPGRHLAQLSEPADFSELPHLADHRRKLGAAAAPSRSPSTCAPGSRSISSGSM